MATHILEFIHEKDTKNTSRFTEVPKDGDTVIGTLYIKKEFCKGAQTLTVTIDTEAGLPVDVDA